VDEYSKKLKLEAHLKLLVYSIVEDCVTLSALCDSLQSGEAEKKGLISISKAQLSVVNESRDYRVFVWIFYELLNLITHRHHALSRLYGELSLMGIDATSIKLDLPFAAYGYHSLTGTIEKGIKVHLAALLGRFTIPLTAMVTPMNVNDSDEFDDVLTDAGIFVDLQRVILVFDRGYWSLERFRDLTTNGIRFITRLKSGVKYTAITKKKESGWEDMGIEFASLPGIRLRLVVIHDCDDELSYVTNIWDLTPEEIHQCYEQRWDMEILNKDLKSNLKIDHFMGRNLNAVLIQIFATLIAYLLIALFRIFHNSLLSPGEIRKLMRYHGHQPLREVRRANPMLCCG
jgi:putative transposase